MRCAAMIQDHAKMDRAKIDRANRIFERLETEKRERALATAAKEAVRLTEINQQGDPPMIAMRVP